MADTIHQVNRTKKKKKKKKEEEEGEEEKRKKERLINRRISTLYTANIFSLSLSHPSGLKRKCVTPAAVSRYAHRTPSRVS